MDGGQKDESLCFPQIVEMRRKRGSVTFSALAMTVLRYESEPKRAPS